jgi:hypothetical protein
MYVDCKCTDRLCTKHLFYFSSYEYKIIGRGKDLTLFMANKLTKWTIIVPTKCTILLKAQDITICTFLSLHS